MKDNSSCRLLSRTTNAEAVAEEAKGPQVLAMAAAAVGLHGAVRTGLQCHIPCAAGSAAPYIPQSFLR